MKTVIAKIDDETLRELEEVAMGSNRSELIRKALREYIARRRIEQRRREVEGYVGSGGESEAMKSLAEADMDHAAELLRDAEEGRR